MEGAVQDWIEQYQADEDSRGEALAGLVNFTLRVSLVCQQASSNAVWIPRLTLPIFRQYSAADAISLSTATKRKI